MSVSLHIERLILEGLPVESHQKGLVRATVEAELLRLIDTLGLGPSVASQAAVPYLYGGTVQLPESVSPAILGTEIARAVHGSLRR